MEIRLEVNITVKDIDKHINPENVARLVAYLLRLDDSTEGLKIDSVRVVNPQKF